MSVINKPISGIRSALVLRKAALVVHVETGYSGLQVSVPNLSIIKVCTDILSKKKSSNQLLCGSV